MGVLQLVLAAFAAYVLVRAAFIFGGGVGLAAAVLLIAGGATMAFRRDSRPIAAGLLLGAAVSAMALTL